MMKVPPLPEYSLLETPEVQSVLFREYEKDPDEFLDALPESMAELIRITSIGSTLKLVSEYGGGKVYIPKATEVAGCPSKITELIGEEDSAAIGKVFGGESINIPQPNSLLCLYWSDLTVKLRAEGRSISEITKAVPHSERWVYLVLQSERQRALAPIA